MPHVLVGCHLCSTAIWCDLMTVGHQPLVVAGGEVLGKHPAVCSQE